MDRKIPTAINLHKRARELEIQFDRVSYRLGCEFLRVFSPSAEVRGHGNPVLQTGKKNVVILGVEMVGNYAVKLTFDDGHNSGIYDWGYLYNLCVNKDEHWDGYLEKVHKAGASRDPETTVLKLV